MTNIFLDIETKPNPKLIDLFTSKIKAPKTYKDEEKIKAYIEEKKSDLVKQMSTDIDFCEISLIGIKINDDPAKLIQLFELLDLLNEHLKIKAEPASDYQERVLNFRLITFNGKKFDLPVIIREAIRQGLDAPFRELKEWTKKFKTSHHIDLMELLADGDYKSLDLYCQVYLGESKEEINFETCSQEELEKHCLEDVEKTAKLFNKFNKLI